MLEPRSFQLFTAEDEGKDAAAIMAALASIKALPKENDLFLLNYFNEIPVSFAANIDRVGAGTVEMTAHKVQLVTMQDQKMTFLRSDHLPHNVFAKVLRIDYKKKQVLLSDFSYAIIRSSRREYVRTRVKEKVDVRFESEEWSVRGDLDDISIGGLSIFGPERSSAETGTDGQAVFSLAGKKLEVPCRLLRIADGEYGKKYIFKFDPTPKVETLVSQFICQIQNETIRELKDRAEMMEAEGGDGE